MRNLVFTLLLFPLLLSAQDENNKSTKDGWAIHLGAGFMYGGNVGFLTERQILLNKKLRISPFVSVGIAEGGTDSISKRIYYIFGYAAGANLEYGKKHRILLGTHFSGLNLIGNSVVKVKKNFLPGASIIIGYKGTAHFGLIWQVYVGDIYMQDQFSENKHFSHYSQFGVGIGYKF